MTDYLIYDPTGTVDKLFSLPHHCEKDPQRMSASENVILVEDKEFDRLLAAHRGHIKALFVVQRTSAADFRALKELADFVLEMPAEKVEVEALCALLEGHVESSSVDMSSMLPPEIVQKYQNSIFDKIEEVEKLIQAIAKAPTKELLMDLRNSVHKFAGNAASYGYTAATPLCRAHEAFLEKSYESPQKDKLVKANQIFLRKFRLTMQKLNLAPLPQELYT